ncbi:MULTISPECIES: 3,4-dihydroxyphenylacetate 2,3-dioxygenase [Metallosphaera]|uniref:3,4-dihydroxyphenylacetate 2,3-dioxygenase n=3 Tax=Metallosphaera TaxID=41980 RepID=A4YHM8_METS5|nr:MULTISPECIES: 3,4-dihydroxyphenylacetate 2,3-dioxygenase [Metallosphaera]ABP95930.1 3,4-dihydroxyphenylacetate 2,3-dioxygenase [Metallosphaera sedula DSM 5348]AIM27914.1 3,4-dihydroxyphenylacetate 2,3-dioxygenase [Metallosphaera sedula]AKV74749.1 3,4-dihydroxyphenylacetate 2,3-dioxygenase [Metallosphaera sedula]AKV76986.1 3,4-dihydroxyphenylacetate 2,3-dioxygenase [Metallosphaera sedula]AKV79237.1 3,4-dihydroxyphenylacetate 2,3-dioxygenase [Metallosphaera sedula]
MLDILRVSHVVYRVTDLDRALFFYRDLLGFVETERNGNEAYLRGVEEGQHHSLVLRKADSPGLSYASLRVRKPEVLDQAREKFDEIGIRYRRMKERGVEEAILFEDPQGLPILLYHDMEYVGDRRLKFHEYRGVTPVRIDHINFMVRDLDVEVEFYTKVFGFTETETFLDRDGKKMVSWMTKIGHSHEIAIARSSRNVPGFHHATFYVHDVRDIIRAADLVSSAQLWDSLERGPGRHGVTQGFYVYLRDQDRNRIEFFTGDYFVLDPDKWKPIAWTWDQLRYRSDFWGREVPETWLKEWVPVEDITGKLRGWNN